MLAILINLLTLFRVQLMKYGLTDAGYKIQNPNLPLEGIKIVDIGCGGGISSEAPK